MFLTDLKSNMMPCVGFILSIKWVSQLHRYLVFTHLCHLFLERECESCASVHEGPCPVGYVLQPLDDEGGGDAEWEIPYDVKVWWICGATFSHLLVT